MKTALGGINGRLHNKEEYISDQIYNSVNHPKEKKKTNNENNFKDLWDKIKHTKICT